MFQHLDRDFGCQRFRSFPDTGEIVTHDTEVSKHRGRPVAAFLISSPEDRRKANALQLRRRVCHLQERGVPVSARAPVASYVEATSHTQGESHDAQLWWDERRLEWRLDPVGVNLMKNKLNHTTNYTFPTLSKFTSGFRSHHSISVSPEGALHRTKSGQQSQAYNTLHSRQSRPFNGAPEKSHKK